MTTVGDLLTGTSAIELPLTAAERQSMPGLGRNPALLRLLDIRSDGYAQRNPDHDEGSASTVLLAMVRG